ncbi:MAG: 6-bladed beta-propeller [Magnetococcus sp. DMHC-6]
MSRIKNFSVCLFLFTSFALFGCTELRHRMIYGVEGLTLEQRPLWPALPDVPRYQYAGQLLGPENFQVVEESLPQGTEQAIWWVVGLDPEEEFKRRNPKGLQRPQSGVVDESGRIYVTDVSHQGVLVFDSVAGKLLTWTKAGEYLAFNTPVGIALGVNREILVADAELGVLVRLDREGNPLGTIGEGQLARPTGLVRDPVLGRIYVADTRADNVKVFNDKGELLLVIGNPGDDVEGGLNAPTHLAFAKGRLYVSDTLNARVQIFDEGGKLVGVIGQRGTQVGNLVRPKGVALDNEGNLYVVESFHDYLLVFNEDGDLLLPIGGTGKEVGQFYLPSGLWTDDRGRMFVADMFNGRVIIFQFLGGE